MMLGFTDPSSPFSCDVDAAVAATAQLLAAARTSGVPVVHTRGEFDEAGLRTAAAFIEKLPGLAAFRVGSPWTEIDERLAPIDGELVLTKLFPSAFFGTTLVPFLVSHRCDSVVCAGTSTSGCVRATVVDAVQHGYRAYVPRDAVADRDAGPHEAALFDIGAKYGHLVSTDEALKLLGGAA